MAAMKVLVLYNDPVLPAGHPDFESEQQVVSTVEIVSKNLAQAGFAVSRLGVGTDSRVLLDCLRELRPDVVFNLFEGIPDQPNTEAFVAGLLEWSGIPFTGSPFMTLTLARSKHQCKYLFLGAGMPTPEFLVVHDLAVPECRLPWPVIVKPAQEDASVGLDQGSVVTDQHGLNRRVAKLLKAYGPPILVEEFIPGRELNVSIIEDPGLRVLPISEVLFVNQEPGYWPIVTYDAKWRPGSRDFEATPPRYPADVTPKLTERLGEIARQAFRLLGCRDYARCDFRVRPNGKPYLLEVNPNPDFCDMAGLAGSLNSAGFPHEQFTVDLVHIALARGKKTGNGQMTGPRGRQHGGKKTPVAGNGKRKASSRTLAV
jgi:D-alanine-D-alanine ligase